MKRFVAILLSATMTLAWTIGAYAADDRGLADAILKAKEYINVPADHKEVNYRISDSEEKDKKYYLSWHGEDGSTEVVLDYDGCLLAYYVYRDTYEEAPLAKFTTKETEAAANAFLKVVYGDSASDFRPESQSIYRDTHNFVYTIYQNDVPVLNGNAYISVDPDSCTVTGFRGIGKEFFKIEYSAPGELVGENTAMLALFDGEYPLPEYQMHTEYEDDVLTRTAFLAFNIHERSRGVDAATGEIIDLNYSTDMNKLDMAASGAMTEDAAEADAGFTPEELEAIEEVKGLISREEATNIVKELFPVAKDETFTNYNTYSDRYSEKSYIRLYADNAGAVLNGKTGIVESFSYHVYEDKEPVTEDYTAVADELIKKAAYDIVDKLSEGTIRESYNDSRVSYSYSRMENGYKCADEGINISINNKGQVVSYYRTWYDDLNYPIPSGVLAEEDTLDALGDVFDFDLIYNVDKDYNVTLAYAFGESGLMAANGAQRLDYDGNISIEEPEPGIEDIKGHWAEKYVTQLFNSGYQINDTLFHPEQPITYGELNELFHTYYPMPLRDGVSREDIEDSTLTKYQLAEYIINYCGFEKLMNYPDIFVTDFTDEIDREYLPAVAITRGLKVFVGDENGCFNGEKQVTRAEAAVALYNLLTLEG